MITKNCTKCGKQKSLSAFYVDKRTKDGLRSECKECTNDKVKKYYYTHRIKCIERNTKYRKAHKIKRRKRDKKHYETIIGRLRHIYCAMKQRCNNPDHPAYKHYGGRGIKCLFKSSDEFINYVINELQTDPRGLTIDRIDNNGYYEPGNIRFVTQAENNKNKKR